MQGRDEADAARMLCPPTAQPNGDERDVCSISAQFGGTPAETFGMLGAGDFVGGADCLHPNLSGHSRIAAAFNDVFVG